MPVLFSDDSDSDAHRDKALAFPSGQKIATPSRLPRTGGALVGREAELAALEAAWQDKTVHILSIVAWGGVGKTSLVTEWVNSLAARDFEGADYFDWSFYSQGTSDQSSASADAFLDAALRFFGDSEVADSQAGAWEKGSRLAQLVGERRTLLVLDGLEPLQHPPGAQGGVLKDPGLQALLRGVALRNAGLCVLTTRHAVVELAPYLNSVAREWNLDRLSTEAGVELLQRLKVQGNKAELAAAVEEVDGHALTLNLVGRYVVRALGGDIRKRDRMRLQKADEKTQSHGHAFRAMATYERWLAAGGEDHARQLALLRLLGLFDRPAPGPCLAALRIEPAIVGLTEPLLGLDEEDWNSLLTDLAEAHLVVQSGDGLDAHPLIREYFASRLKGEEAKRLGFEEEPVPDPADRGKAWREAHSRLFDILKKSTEHRPRTLDGLRPLYQAVYHGCQAGRQQEACDEVYHDRILRGTGAGGHYSWRKLGAFGADLGAVACFFELPWNRVSPSLSEAYQAWLLNQAAFHLRALGRLREAVEPMRAGIEGAARLEDWNNAARYASNQSELELTLGEVQAAGVDAEQSVIFADRSGDAFLRMSFRTTLADARHQAGEDGTALALFREAEVLQAESQPQYPLLYSLAGFRYCDLLLAPAERAAGSGRDARAPSGVEACVEVERRAAQALPVGVQNNWILDIALDHISLGRARLYRAILEGRASEAAAEAQGDIEKAVSGLRNAGYQHMLVLGLLTRAWLRFTCGDAEGARADLDEAWEIAERGSMRLHLADVALYRARVFKDRAALAEARRLVTECGYGRRLAEIEDLETAAKSWPDTISERELMSSTKKRFRVALSFAGENRSFVREVAGHLAARLGQGRVLYDHYYEAEFARPDLDVYLQALYHDESELIVVFLCADYEKKEWCGLEWRAIRDLIKKRKSSTVMPLRFDMTEIPGLFSGDGYIWIGDRQPQDIAERILERLGNATTSSVAAALVAPPAPPALVAAKPSAALELWREKLEELRAAEPMTVDPDAKFRLRKLIEEAEAKIRELGG